MNASSEPPRPGGPDHASLRAGDQDREHVAEVLREACVEGRLSVTELEERLEGAFAARTHGELDALIRDLPRGLHRGPPGPGMLVLIPSPVTIKTGVDNERRTGHWRVPEQLIVRAHLGNVRLDFTSALISHHRIHIDVRTDAGNVVLVVPRGWRVDTDSVRRGLGSVKNRVAEPLHPDVEIVVTGLAAVSNLIVRHPRPERWRWLTGI